MGTLKEVLEQLFTQAKTEEKSQDVTVARGLYLRATFDHGMRKLLLGRKAPADESKKGPSPKEVQICAEHAGIRWYTQDAGYSAMKGMHWILISETPNPHREKWIREILEAKAFRDEHWAKGSVGWDNYQSGLKKLSDAELEKEHVFNVKTLPSPQSEQMWEALPGLPAEGSTGPKSKRKKQSEEKQPPLLGGGS
ncbi:hypothetical protein [Deinococcus misasensis]|uniref:hypothetical protein n=1 Tax=Deinococcus misasensis TaxID=392413 RepID=UPI000559026D|nr:hypothetical protein [Deinococcus misasensis]